MSASDETTLKKVFGRSKPSSNLTLKTKWYLLITFHYRKCMLPLQYLSDWHLNSGLCLKEIPEEKHLKLSDYLNQI